MNDRDPFQRCFSFVSQNVFGLPDDVLALCSTQSQLICIRRLTGNGSKSSKVISSSFSQPADKTFLLVEVTDSNDATRLINTFFLSIHDVKQLLYCKHGQFVCPFTPERVMIISNLL